MILFLSQGLSTDECACQKEQSISFYVAIIPQIIKSCVFLSLTKRQMSDTPAQDSPSPWHLYIPWYIPPLALAHEATQRTFPPWFPCASLPILMVPHHTDITALATHNSNQVIQVLKKHRTNRMVPKMSPGRPLRCHGIASPKDTVCLSQLVAGTHSSKFGYLGMLRMLKKKDQHITEKKETMQFAVQPPKIHSKIACFFAFLAPLPQVGQPGKLEPPPQLFHKSGTDVLATNYIHITHHITSHNYANVIAVSPF